METRHPRLRSILLVEGHALLREALRDLLTDVEPDVTIVEAASAREAVSLLERTEPLLAVMDVGIPDFGDVAALHRVASASPELPVIALGDAATLSYALLVADAGAAAYVCKSDLPGALVSAVQSLLRGRTAEAS